MEALERIAEARPDLIVADIMMPVMDGYVLCRRLRTDPRTCTIPFLFLTAKDDDRDRIRGPEWGAMTSLRNPATLAARMPAWRPRWPPSRAWRTSGPARTASTGTPP